ncbi:MAG: DUF192 domain-containing protein [Bdellovibrionales bacterium]|nr:DUF192 domain-containing protein [Bdellovibrionales bacterium]
MYRETPLKLNQGMLFLFDREKKQNFWMKNTFIDLDLLFFDRKKRLVEWTSMDGLKSVMQNEIPEYASREKAQYVLELTKGWVNHFKIKKGARLKYKE